jgi:hypothetical protein
MFYVGHESNNIFFQFQYDIQLIYLPLFNIIEERDLTMDEIQYVLSQCFIGNDQLDEHIKAHHHSLIP